MSKTKELKINLDAFSTEDLRVFEDEIKAEIYKRKREKNLVYIEKLIALINETIDNTDCESWEFETEDEDLFYITDVLKGLEYHRKVTLAEE